jgi:AraC-like DNA-binding protein
MHHGSVHMRLPDAENFQGGSMVQRSADHLLLDWWSEAVHYTRTDADVQADGRTGSLLLVPRRGVLDVEQGGKQVRLQPGQAVIITKSRASALGHDFWARAWTFDTMDARWQDDQDDVAGQPVALDLAHGLGSVVRGMISTVSSQRQTLNGYEFARCCTTINDLLFACVTDRGGLPDTLDSVEYAVREYVARHACEPDLTPRSVARSLGWSVRQIQLALQRAGTTTTDLIRSTRVTRAADLLRHAPPDTTITSIAIASGFRSMTTFEVVFKKRFGITPREARALHRATDDSAPAGRRGPALGRCSRSRGLSMPSTFRQDPAGPGIGRHG